jgi:hypothetical protein
MAYSPQNFPVDWVKSVDYPVLQLVIGHGLAPHQGLHLQAGWWNDVGAIIAGHEAIMEKNRVAAGVVFLKLFGFGNRGVAYPCPSAPFRPGKVSICLEDLAVDLDQGIYEILLKPFVCQVPAGIHELF